MAEAACDRAIDRAIAIDRARAIARDRFGPDAIGPATVLRSRPAR
ncbi:hypothetical protein ACWD3Z_46605 [Streptomyces sp. NPDC002740]